MSHDPRSPSDAADHDSYPFIEGSKSGIFRDHACWKCNDGEKPCANVDPRRCGYPHARND